MIMQRRLGRSSIKVRRDKVVIATKFGNLFDEQSKQITGTDASPEFIRRACDASLKRLGTDYPERAEVFAQGRHCTAVQHEENIFNDNAAVIAVCEKYNLASINRGPLAMESWPLTKDKMQEIAKIL